MAANARQNMVRQDSVARQRKQLAAAAAATTEGGCRGQEVRGKAYGGVRRPLSSRAADGLPGSAKKTKPKSIFKTQNPTKIDQKLTQIDPKTLHDLH
jgi:hypothetical protein